MKPMVFERIHKIWNRGLFQGSKTSRNYFEGWYFKLVDAAEETILAVIPGIALGEDNEESHAFIQVLNGKTGDSAYYTFSVDDFIKPSRKFEVRINDNYFSVDSLKLDLNQSDHSIRGELHFDTLVPVPHTVLSPGFMGWGAFVPFMQCKHDIVSMSHSLQGTLELDGARIVFDGGKGYLEKDWGHSFSSSYIWMQSNHFAQEAASFLLVIARIPWLHLTITGFGAVLWYNDRFFTFATYTGAKITHFEKQEQNLVRITLEDNRFQLTIEAIQGSVWELKSPYKGTMTKRIFESLTSAINVKLYEKTKTGNQLLLEDHGRNAGLELMDENDELSHHLNK